MFHKTEYRGISVDHHGNVARCLMFGDFPEPLKTAVDLKSHCLYSKYDSSADSYGCTLRDSPCGAFKYFKARDKLIFQEKRAKQEQRRLEKLSRSEEYFEVPSEMQPQKNALKPLKILSLKLVPPQNINP